MLVQDRTEMSKRTRNSGGGEGEGATPQFGEKVQLEQVGEQVEQVEQVGG